MKIHSNFVIEDVNASKYTDDEKISSLIKEIRFQDREVERLIRQANILKKGYDEALEAAEQLRAELLKYGVIVRNTNEHILIG